MFGSQRRRQNGDAQGIADQDAELQVQEIRPGAREERSARIAGEQRARQRARDLPARRAHRDERAGRDRRADGEGGDAAGERNCAPRSGEDREQAGPEGEAERKLSRR